MSRVVRVYCGNTIGASSMFEEPPECFDEREVPISDEPGWELFESYVCPGCGLTNMVVDHAQS